MPNKIPLVFYRESGIRKLNQLLNPVVVNITDLPKGSIYHFVNEDIDNPNIDPSEPILNYPSASRIALEYVTELKEFEGNPRRVNYQYQVKAREFTRVYKKFKINKDAVATNSNPRVLTLINYSYINNFYKYPPTKYAYISSWRNITSTIYSNIEEVCKRSSFDNYITIPVPESIPSRALLNKASNNFNLSMVKIFKDTGTLTLLELWKWIDPSTRDKSIFSKISKDHLKKVNFIFKAVNGKASIVNMAYMFSWIEGNDNLTPIKSLITKNPVYIQKALLYFLIVLNTTLNTETDTEEDIKDTEEVKDEYTKAFEETEDELNEDNEEPSPSLGLNTNIPTPSDKVDLEGEVDFDDDPKEISMADIDAMLDDLEKLEKKKLKTLGLEVDGDEIVEVQKTEEDSIAIESMIFNRLDNKETLLKKLEDRIDNGNLTAAEYRKVIKDLEKYESMKDPYGTGKLLKDAKVVTTDDIKIDEVNSTIKVSYLVPQESMKKSSLLSFTEDYTNSVMKKDMLSMVDSLQRGGIVVRNYDVKEENTILGSYEIHSLDLKPVDGAASTIHFKVPKVDKDGTFSVNGSKYVYRTQRVDVPIRKIAPTKVALTSYYGKSFVSLDEKKAYSEIDYIVRTLESLAIEDASKVITVAPADVFDPEFTAPFIYSMLSNYYSSIELDSCTLYFDHESRRAIPINKDITLIENNGSVLVGVSKKGNPIMVDIQNNFYAIVGDEIKSLGTIYDLAGIDNLKAPVEYANVKVFSRDVPVGIYLAYFLGFSKLLKYLNVKYRVVAPRKQKDLANDEYAITFRDGSYIFSRKDRKASLILGGFTTVQKELKRYDAVDLDSQDVYLNLLLNKKITGIHLKEMENTQDYFIDHITLEVLKEMKEPTTFNGLLVRSCELLLTYYHPKTQDLNYMRFRGYERFSGFAYGALVDAIRSYKGRNISGKAKVDISPYEVWNKILKDESVKIVEDINPIQNLKEKEIVTFAGEGGRSKETITMEMRAYHTSDIGNISEANIDSGDTGINTYMPPNPHVASLRGVIKSKTEKEKNASILTMGETSILSTSCLLAPMVYKDD